MSSKRKRRRIIKELTCSRCDTKLDGNQIYCHECGEPTSVLKHDLSAKQIIQNTWNSYMSNKGQNYSFAIFYFFVLLVPLAIIVYHTHTNYYLHNLILLLFLPLLLIPMAIKSNKGQDALTIPAYFANLKSYPVMFLFVLLNIVYFFLLKAVTTSVDPILNLVRLIMVLYWIAIVFPLPHLMLRKKVNFLNGWRSVYKKGKETRWQHFFVYLFLAIINLFGLALVGIGLLITIPFSFAVIEAYYEEMDSHKLFD